MQSSVLRRSELVLAFVALSMGVSHKRAQHDVYARTEEFAQMMTVEMSKQTRADAIASIQRYFKENMPEPIGDLAAGLLLNFFIEEIGPAIYNRAIADAQNRMELRVSDLNGELYAEEFPYWRKIDSKQKNRR